jgi:hypothetical protein
MEVLFVLIPDAKRVRFKRARKKQTPISLTAKGTQTSSSFEMVQLEDQRKPVIQLGWRYSKDASSFFTTAISIPISLTPGPGS